MRDVCSEVTHAYFSFYVHKDDLKELNSANQTLFDHFLSALIQVSSKLQNLTLLTGGKHYGVHLSPVPSPAREKGPRRGPTESNFYLQQDDFLQAKQQDSAWTWSVIRPDAMFLLALFEGLKHPSFSDLLFATCGPGLIYSVKIVAFLCYFVLLLHGLTLQ